MLDGDLSLRLRDAARKGDIEGVRALLESGADVNAEHTAALWMAAGAGHIETVRLLLERGADIHAYDDLL